MEAANLGAYARSFPTLQKAMVALGSRPSYQSDVRAWAQTAFSARASLGVRGPDDPLRSVGIPTWFYGHEPPNVFGQAIAKYFSNALREDGLLARCTHGVVVLPGSAGTVQEIFQAATRVFYERMPTRGGSDSLPPLILVGRTHWTRTLPVWPALQTLARSTPSGRMVQALHLVDTPGQAAAIVTERHTAS